MNMEMLYHFLYTTFFLLSYFCLFSFSFGLQETERTVSILSDVLFAYWLLWISKCFFASEKKKLKKL